MTRQPIRLPSRWRKRVTSRKRAPAVARGRLTILAASGDEEAFLAAALDALESPQRLDREAALEALQQRPLPEARDALRRLYIHLDEDPMKRDQGADQRRAVLRVLHAIGDGRNADLALRAADSVEIAYGGDDISWALRTDGLRLVGEWAPQLLPYIAAEHLDDAPPPAGEPAATAFELLAGGGHALTLYQWLLAGGYEREHGPHAVQRLVEAEPPPQIVRRLLDTTLASAMRHQNDTLCTVLTEIIVTLELEDSYGAIERILSSHISDELYAFIAITLARSNRPALLAILERQLFEGRRSRLILEALQIRTTPEQQAILDRWEQR